MIDGYTFVQISDLHNAEFGDRKERLIEMIYTEEPDVIFLTGDLIDAKKTDIDVALDFAEQIVKIAPVYYVTGNHEAWTKSYEILESGLKKAGVTILDNSFTLLQRDSTVISLAGLADPSFTHSNADASAILVKYWNDMSLDGSRYTILMSHRPETFNFYVSQGIDLVFSGHAHGGQFRIPLLGGIVAPDQGIFPKYTSGIYEQSNTKMIVSRGLGNSIIPFRINNRPEMIVVPLSIKRFYR